MKRLIILIAFLSLSLADLPVHCVKHQIVGKWTIQMQKPSLKGYQTYPLFPRSWASNLWA